MPSNGFNELFFYFFFSLHSCFTKIPYFQWCCNGHPCTCGFPPFWDEFLGEMCQSGARGTRTGHLWAFWYELPNCFSKVLYYSVTPRVACTGLPVHTPFVPQAQWDKKLVPQFELIHCFPPLESVNSLKTVMSAEPPACLGMWLIVIPAFWEALLGSILHS